ncbi:hypothetical protein [Croceicoccus pelagius]|uniref:Uncharacterized protein n=1 Tax=Croceicoccus pelagius TaxID=1703341 RepID=A0A917DE55_9SPHN|nr:hypothetical protein [Croceicoccus pelagius]GGD30959.1 hypothetical protein GCM10010989_01360 [Croceicoccus pelagius]
MTLDYLVASDAGRWTVVAVSALLVAALALFGDRRRMKRKAPDSVGWVPWTPVFFVALLVAVVTGGLALKTWIAPV